MKAVTIIIGALVVVAGAACFLISRKSGTAPLPQPEPVRRIDPPTSVNSDPTGVFQRAFWRHPAAGDTILHAERNEWSDDDGLKKWQWFIVVKPSPELVKHLWADNAFSLVAKPSASKTGGTPEWFTPPHESVEILQAPAGNMQLILSRSDGVLYASDSGKGFQSGAPEAPHLPSQPAASPGRLPTTPPPVPEETEGK